MWPDTAGRFASRESTLSNFEGFKGFLLLKRDGAGALFAWPPLPSYLGALSHLGRWRWRQGGAVHGEHEAPCSQHQRGQPARGPVPPRRLWGLNFRVYKMFVGIHALQPMQAQCPRTGIAEHPQPKHQNKALR